MDRIQKKTEISTIQERFERMASAVITDFRGLNVEKINMLRSEFRKADVEYRVVKNTLVKLAIKDQKYGEAVSEFLQGPTAIAWSYEDPVSPAKIIANFAKDNEKLKIKGGVIEDGTVLDAAGIEKLSKMPGKAEIQAKLLATFMAPANDMVRLFAAAPTNFMYLLNARKSQLDEQ